MNSKKRNTKIDSKQKIFFVGGGIAAILAIIALTSMSSYSLRTAAYFRTPNMIIAHSPSPSPSPTPVCQSLTTAQIADYQHRIHNLGVEISGLSQQITTADQERVKLITGVHTLEGYLRGATTQARINSLQTAINNLLAQIDRIGIQVQSLERQIEELDTQQNHYQQILALSCNAGVIKNVK